VCEIGCGPNLNISLEQSGGSRGIYHSLLHYGAPAGPPFHELAWYLFAHHRLCQKPFHNQRL
jgi:hypothetical protein